LNKTIAREIMSKGETIMNAEQRQKIQRRIEKKVEPIEVLDGSAWANNYIGELAREVEKTQNKINEIVGALNQNMEEIIRRIEQMR
jgi:enoyl-[acyl-carrier-protein] reductase (NADH)